ncbi:MAG: fluoride efflux transporter CrcB [Bacteroidia bacterium]
MKNIVLVFLGGGIGSVARYVLTLIVPRTLDAFPVAILIANGLACFVIGIVSCLMLSKNYINQNVVLLVSTGFCGGLSTFSTFSNDNYTLYTSKEFSLLFANIALNITVCFVAVVLGFMLAKRM